MVSIHDTRVPDIEALGYLRLLCDAKSLDYIPFIVVSH
jgi:hypothetical protein